MQGVTLPAGAQEKPAPKKGKKSSKRQPASDEDPWQNYARQASEEASPTHAASVHEEDLDDLHTGRAPELPARACFSICLCCEEQSGILLAAPDARLAHCSDAHLAKAC